MEELAALRREISEAEVAAEVDRVQDVHLIFKRIAPSTSFFARPELPWHWTGWRNTIILVR